MNSSWLEFEIPWSRAIACECPNRSDAPDSDAAWLDGAAVDPATGTPGVSLIACDPIAVIEQFAGSSAEFRIAGRIVDRDENGWRLWRRACNDLDSTPPFSRLSGSPSYRDSVSTPLDKPASVGMQSDAMHGFGPGWVGFVGYETASQLELLPRRDSLDMHLPILRFALYDRVLLLNHLQRRAIAAFAPALREKLGLPRIRDLDGLSLWKTIRKSQPRPASRGLHADSGSPSACPQFESPCPHFESNVRRALDYIAAGDVYQVNLSHRIRLDRVPDPRAVHAALRRRNPAAYSALLHWRVRESDSWRAVISASPELFLELRNGFVRTRPIKGTRPRTGDPVLDALHRRELLDSDKDAAELAMIVDLHRNDLGRVCDIGSVRVAAPRLIEEHPTVFHTVSEVTGRLQSRFESAPGRTGFPPTPFNPDPHSAVLYPFSPTASSDALDLLAACFPAGSVTGAPKIRAMQIIHELEAAPRGVYSGAIGWLGLRGDMSFNVAIRTLQQHNETAWLHVGSGIVADSDPAAEYEETLAKARGVLEAVAGVGAAPSPALGT